MGGMDREGHEGRRRLERQGGRCLTALPPMEDWNFLEQQWEVRKGHRWGELGRVASCSHRSGGREV